MKGIVMYRSGSMPRPRARSLQLDAQILYLFVALCEA